MSCLQNVFAAYYKFPSNNFPPLHEILATKNATRHNTLVKYLLPTARPTGLTPPKTLPYKF